MNASDYHLQCYRLSDDYGLLFDLSGYHNPFGNQMDVKLLEFGSGNVFPITLKLKQPHTFGYVSIFSIEGYEQANTILMCVSTHYFVFPVRPDDTIACSNSERIDIREFQKRVLEVHSKHQKTHNLNMALSPIQSQGLRAILKDKPRDFTISSEDSETFKVHSFLLSSLWPFFEAAATIEMNEKATKTLHLPFSKSIVQTVVDFLYGKEVFITDMNSAIEIMSIAALYDIQELKKLSLVYILKYRMSVDRGTSLKGWKAASEADIEEVQAFFVRHLAPEVSCLEEDGLTSDYTDAQMLDLYRQVAKLKIV